MVTFDLTQVYEKLMSSECIYILFRTATKRKMWESIRNANFDGAVDCMIMTADDDTI